MKKFLKGWWEVIVFALVLIVLRIWVLAPILVDGHSMDPTLQDGERMIMVKPLSVERFNIVVATEPGVDGEPDKNIIKRVIGLPGDKLLFDNDRLYINGEEYSEPYLAEFQKMWHEDKLQEQYNFSSFYQDLAREASAFTISYEGDATFTVNVPEGHYFLMGDDRLISKDSRDRAVGPIPAEDIQGTVVLSFWPFDRIRFGFQP